MYKQISEELKANLIQKSKTIAHEVLADFNSKDKVIVDGEEKTFEDAILYIRKAVVENIYFLKFFEDEKIIRLEHEWYSTDLLTIQKKK